MQPYSELANWDGSLSDVVDSLSTPTPPEPSSHNPPIYAQYHKFMPHRPNQRVGSLTHTFLNPADPTRGN